MPSGISEQSSSDSRLEQFKETLSDLLPEIEEYRRADWYLIKWLEEYKYDVHKAGTALRTATKWRLENKMDYIIREDFGDLASRFPYENGGVDKTGSPILIVPFGRWRISTAVEDGLRDKFLRYAIQMTERNLELLRGAVEKSKGVVNQVIIIFDLAGYSYRQLVHRQTIALLAEWTKRSEEQYPQQLKTFYVINANKVLPILFSLLKPFMSANTVSRVTIFDSNQEEWQKVLFRHIDADQLSQKYGGTRQTTQSQYQYILPD